MKQLLMVVVFTMAVTWATEAWATEATTSQYKGYVAGASFSSTEGCTQTFLTVSVVETTYRSSGTTSTTPRVNVSFEAYDTCTDLQLVSASGSALPNKLAIKNGVVETESDVELFGTLQGTESTLNLRLVWTGFGQQTQDTNTSKFTDAGGNKYVARGSVFSQDATVSGQVTHGSATYDFSTADGYISRVKSGSIRILR
jgi:hypothetical protein